MNAEWKFILYTIIVVVLLFGSGVGFRTLTSKLIVIPVLTISGALFFLIGPYIGDVRKWSIFSWIDDLKNTYPYFVTLWVISMVAIVSFFVLGLFYQSTAKSAIKVFVILIALEYVVLKVNVKYYPAVIVLLLGGLNFFSIFSKEGFIENFYVVALIVGGGLSIYFTYKYDAGVLSATIFTSLAFVAYIGKKSRSHSAVKKCKVNPSLPICKPMCERNPKKYDFCKM